MNIISNLSFGHSNVTDVYDDVAEVTSVMIAKLCVLSVMSFFGTIGNILIIVTILHEKTLKVPGNYFIINLAAADLIITAFSIPVIISNVVMEMNSEVQVNIFCQGTAYLKTIALHVSWYSLAFIALNRYYTVCRFNEYPMHFKKKNIITTIWLMWVWVLAINMPILIGWAIPSDVTDPDKGYYPLYPKHAPPVIYDRSSHDCVLGINGHGGYTYGNGLFVMSLPLFSIMLCYTLVYFAIIQNTKNIESTMGRVRVKKRQARERRISFMLLIVVVTFLLCWMPAIVYDYRSNISSPTHNKVDNVRLVVNWLALSNSGMNVLLYGVMSCAFRNGYIKLFRSCIYRLLQTCCGKCECGKRMIENSENSLKDSYSTASYRGRTPPTRRRLSLHLSSMVVENSNGGSNNSNSVISNIMPLNPISHITLPSSDITTTCEDSFTVDGIYIGTKRVRKPIT